MNLYLIERDDQCDYNQYSEAVVRAESPEAAKMTHPGEEYAFEDGVKVPWKGGPSYSWVHPDNVIVTFLGVAEDPTSGVVCASFHAG